MLLNRTTFGRRTFAIGGKPEASRLAGINVRRHTVLLYALSGLCCGIARRHRGLAGQRRRRRPRRPVRAGRDRGGHHRRHALTGGRGTIVGSLLGVVIFKGITNLFIVNNLEQEDQLIVKGAIIVAAVLLQTSGSPRCVNGPP